ncbi:MAG TPA: energy transducer TonB [Gemmatimonadales bacterium]|jgi:TonB family protein
MFDNLVESNPKNRKITGVFSSSMWSMVLHVLVIYGAVTATSKVKEAIEATAADTQMFFISHNEPEPEPEPEPQLASLTPPPKGFQTVVAITEIPTEIPPVNLNERFDPRDYTGVGQEGGIAQGIEGGTGDVPTDLQAVFVEAVVDEPPIRLSTPNLFYPPLLRDAGIEGNVVFEVIIGVDGHPEPESVRVISSTNKAFERPARDVILGSLYRPGRMRGQPVRVLVRQPITFQIIRR